jgi:hypothetical protein
MTTFQYGADGKLKGLHQLSPERADAIRKLFSGSCAAGVDAQALELAIERYVEGDYSFDWPVLQRAVQNVGFNVMEGKNVSEQFQVNGYFVGSDVARSTFDRVYRSEMDRSPSHVIFFSPLTQWQKLVYLIFCRRFGITELDGREKFKLWATGLDCRMPTLVCETENLLQDTFVSKIEPAGVNGWMVEGFSHVNYKIGFIGRAVVLPVPQRAAA